MTETTIKKRGGYRPGAGPKKKFPGIRMRSWRIDPQTSLLISQWAKDHACTESDALRQMVRKAAACLCLSES